MDTLFRCGNIIKHLLKKHIAICKNINGIVPRQKRVINTLKKHDGSSINLNGLVFGLRHIDELLLLLF